MRLQVRQRDERLTGGADGAGAGGEGWRSPAPPIDVNGTVGPVGGVAEKVVGAEKQGATIFLVPTSEAADARKGASRARVVPVDTFDQARTVLRQGP